jgi:uncharacterized protein YacL
MRIAATASGTRDEAVGSRILRGTIGGAAAGAVFMFVTMWFADSVGDPSTGPLMMISTIVKGEAAMANGTADPTLGWIIHGAISVMFGVAFALVAPLFRTNGTVALAGIVYGALLYVLNFLVIALVVLPIFEMASQPFELAIHIVFGALLALAFFGSGVRASEPVIALNRPATSTR